MDRAFTDERGMSIIRGEDNHFARLASFDGGDFVLKEDVVIGFVELSYRLLAFASALYTIGLRCRERNLNVNILVMGFELRFTWGAKFGIHNVDPKVVTIDRVTAIGKCIEIILLNVLNRTLVVWVGCNVHDVCCLSLCPTLGGLWRLFAP